MHFTVLSALPLPQDISAAISAVPVDNVVSFVAEKLLLKSLSSGKMINTPEVDPSMASAERWECFVAGKVAGLLAPYDENNTDIAYMAFDDRTDEGKNAYEQSGIDCVKTPDGRIITCHCHEFSSRYELHDGKVYQKRFGPLHHRKRTQKSKKYVALPNYPFQKLFPTFDSFMKEYWFCETGEEDGRYGYYFNPSASVRAE